MRPLLPLVSILACLVAGCADEGERASSKVARPDAAAKELTPWRGEYVLRRRSVDRYAIRVMPRSELPDGMNRECEASAFESEATITVTLHRRR